MKQKTQETETCTQKQGGGVSVPCVRWEGEVVLGHRRVTNTN